MPKLVVCLLESLHNRGTVHRATQVKRRDACDVLRSANFETLRRDNIISELQWLTGNARPGATQLNMGGGGRWGPGCHALDQV